MIKFVVGIFGKEMMLHTVLVAEQSLALDSMVNGPMKEAQEKVVIWKDVDEQTFALFAEFVYTGEYTLPDGGVEDQSPPLPNIESTTADEFEDDFTKLKRRRKILNTVSVQAQVVPEQSPQKRTKFRDLVYRSLAPASPLVANKMPGQHPNANFLIHARLYVFAERYDIKKLKPLALQNLHANLSEYCPFGEVFYRDVVLLARYAYENTPSREQHKDKDQLRQLVTCYVADEGSKAVARSKHCLDLIEEVGAFARDLVSELLADGGNQSTTFETGLTVWGSTVSEPMIAN